MVTVLERPKAASPLSLRRAIRSDGWLPRLRREFRAMLALTAQEAAAAVLEGAGPRDFEQFEASWRRLFYNVKKPLTVDIVIDGYEYADGEVSDSIRVLGKASPQIRTDKISMEAISAQIETLVQTRVRVDIEPWLEETASLESLTTVKRYSSVMKTNITGGMTVQEAARMIQAVGLSQSRTRAELMARTTAIWGYNKGAKLRYQDAGFQKIDWILTADDLTCEYCEQIAARSPIIIDQAFASQGETLFGTAGEVDTFEHGAAPKLEIPWDIEHPPLHPHCRCTISVSQESGPSIQQPVRRPRPPRPRPVKRAARKVSQAVVAKKRYGKATTLGEAQAHTSELMGATVDYKPPGTIWGSPMESQEKILEKLNLVNATMADLRERFPNMPEKTLGRLYIANKQGGRASVGYLVPNVKERVLTTQNPLSKGYQALSNEVAEKFKQSHGYYRFVQDGVDEAAGIFRHELGHNLTTADTYRRMVEALDKAGGLTPAANLRKSWGRKHLSDYATKNIHETIAEGFQMVTNPSYKIGTLPKVIENVLFSMVGV